MVYISLRVSVRLNFMVYISLRVSVRLIECISIIVWFFPILTHLTITCCWLPLKSSKVGKQKLIFQFFGEIDIKPPRGDRGGQVIP